MSAETLNIKTRAGVMPDENMLNNTSSMSWNDMLHIFIFSSNSDKLASNSTTSYIKAVSLK